MTKEKLIPLGERPSIVAIQKQLGTNLIGAEVGVNKGYNASYICSVVKPKLLYLIDPWYNFLDLDSGEIIGEAQFIETKKLLQVFDCCKFIRKQSSDAAKDFSDNYFDFVYIDGDHSYDAVLNDATVWYQKIKEKGILAGHDFGLSSVKEAVIKFCMQNQIKKLCSQAEDWWFTKEI